MTKDEFIEAQRALSKRGLQNILIMCGGAVAIVAGASPFLFQPVKKIEHDNGLIDFDPAQHVLHTMVPFIGLVIVGTVILVLVLRFRSKKGLKCPECGVYFDQRAAQVVIGSGNCPHCGKPAIDV